jgi:predicted kinase
MNDGGATGSAGTTLVVIRGNSGSGKSSVARELRLRWGRGVALIEQDYLRRIVLREPDRPGGLAPALIAQTVRFALDHGYSAVLEGILYARLYGPELAALQADHRGRTSFYYLDVPLEETLRRHTTRPQVTQFTPEEMRGWYEPGDLLGVEGERVIGESSSLEQTIAEIVRCSGIELTTSSR